MKVLIAAGVFPPETGGPATYAKLLQDALPAHGIEVVVVPFRSVRALPPIVRHIVYTLLLLVKGARCDVIFAQDPVSVGLPARLVCALTRKCFILRVGGDFAWEQGVQRYGIAENLDEFVKKTYRGRVRQLQGLQSWVARGARVVIVPSEYMRRIVATWGIDDSHIRVIYSAFVPVASPEADTNTLRHRLGMAGHSIVTAARLVPWKGMRLLIELVKDIPDTTLYIAGDGPERAALEARVRAIGVVDRVRFLGALPRPRLFEYIAAADVFVLNTGYEGMSYQLLEVMSLGTPIITTPVGGNPELITHEKEGTLVPYNDGATLRHAIKDVLSRDTSTMTLAARQKITRFSAERMLDETIRLLKDVCAS